MIEKDFMAYYHIPGVYSLQINTNLQYKNYDFCREIEFHRENLVGDAGDLEISV